MTLKGLFLPGYACTSKIWQMIRDEFDSICEPTWVDWPIQAIPSFHHVADFSHWLYTAVGVESYDFVVGHSLGGLAALQLVAMAEGVEPTVILIETFLTSPAPFFQNLLFDKAASVPAQLISVMLNREKIHYSPVLGDRLREVDMTEWVLTRKKMLYALYGDRGSGVPEKVVNELRWSESLSACVEVKVIPDACHFPMIENPSATLKSLRRILDL